MKSFRDLRKTSLTRCALSAIALTGSACGGGGGGSDAFVGAAIVNIDAVPRDARSDNYRSPVLIITDRSF